MVGCILFRGQPFHNGHMNMVQKAYEDCRKCGCDLYIFVGSADKVGTVRNPLPIEFRTMLIEGALHEEYAMQDLAHIHVIPMCDMTDESDNSYSWGRYLFVKMLYYTKDSDMTIYYSDRPDIMLNWFDQQDRWCLRFKFLDRFEGISATLVRNLIMNDMPVDKYIPPFVHMHMEEIKKYMKEAACGSKNSN